MIRCLVIAGHGRTDGRTDARLKVTLSAEGWVPHLKKITKTEKIMYLTPPSSKKRNLASSFARFSIPISVVTSSPRAS